MASPAGCGGRRRARAGVTPAQRQDDAEARLRLLAEVAEIAPAPQQDDVRRLHPRLTDALPQLPTVVAHIDRVQQDLAAALCCEQPALLAWAWLRPQALGWSSRDILAAIPEAWRAAARVLLAAENGAVWVSSAVERGQSILRVHLAVQRTRSSGMLALLAVWPNQRVFTRGGQKGQSPLHLSGMTAALTDWLVALGYPPVEPALPPAALTDTLALAA